MRHTNSGDILMNKVVVWKYGSFYENENQSCSSNIWNVYKQKQVLIFFLLNMVSLGDTQYDF